MLLSGTRRGCELEGWEREQTIRSPKLKFWSGCRHAMTRSWVRQWEEIAEAEWKQDHRRELCSRVEVNNIKRISSCVINTEKPLLQCFSNFNVRKNHLEILVKCRIRSSRLTSSPVLLPLLLLCKSPQVAFEQQGCRVDLPCNCIQETIDKLCL